LEGQTRKSVNMAKKKCKKLDNKFSFPINSIEFKKMYFFLMIVLFKRSFS